MEKIDHKIILKNIYKPKKGKINIIEVPKLSFLMINGTGRPNEKSFQDATQTIYTVAYTLKFLIRDELNIDYKVMPMEVVWELDRQNKKFNWLLMIMQPDFITQKFLEKALEIIKTKNKILNSEIKFFSYKTGLCVQFLHVGPYEKMNDSLKLMKEFASGKNYETENDTHDIYLNDPRKTKPENLKTIMLLKIKK